MNTDVNLGFSTGVQNVSINGKCTVHVNFTDSAFIERVFNAFDVLDGLEDKYRPLIENAQSGKEVFGYARDRDAEMRDVVNGIFGEDVCSPIFGNMHISAAAEGLPLWANMLLAFIDNMDSTLANEKKQTNPRLKKYVEKYQKYQKKQ